MDGGTTCLCGAESQQSKGGRQQSAARIALHGEGATRSDLHSSTSDGAYGIYVLTPVSGSPATDRARQVFQLQWLEVPLGAMAAGESKSASIYYAAVRLQS